MQKQLMYFDYAAATPVDNKVLEAMRPFWQDTFYNPSATYLAAQHVRKSIETSREIVAHWLGSRPTEVVFTAGGSEANNLAIHGIMRRYPKAQVITSAVEHDSVLNAANHYSNKLAPVIADGRLDVSALRKLITDDTVLVSIMYANNEVGTIQPLSEVVQLLNEVKRQRQQSKIDLPLYLHVDACQAGNYLALNVARLGVDLMTINGGKIYGPKQSGCLYVKAGIVLEPLVDGGGQEFNLRSGTENVAGIVGFATALEIAQQMRKSEVDRLKSIQQNWFKDAQQAIPHIIINGSQKHRLPNNLHITIPNIDNERMIMELDEQGMLVAAGSACSASDEEPSHVLKAMGIDDADAQASLRITIGRQTTAEHLEHLLTSLKTLVG